MNKFDWRSLLRFHGGSLLMILFGTILTISPDSASVLVSAVLGWLLIAFGVMILLTGILGGIEVMTILQGAALIMAGAWLHRHPLMIASVLGIVLGLTALSQGIKKGKRAMRLKLYGSFWIWDAGMAAMELLAGLVLILTPLSLSRAVVAVAGFFMVVCGVLDLLSTRKNDGPGSYSNIIDAE